MWKSDELVHQSATKTTTIYITVVDVGFNIYDGAGKGKRSPDDETLTGERNVEPAIFTERSLDSSLTDVNSSGYDDNQNNISKSNSSAASEDDIGELKKPEPKSPDLEYTYFGEISQTDLYSISGFQKMEYLMKNIVFYMLLKLYVAD